jgi:cytidylate kinase
MAERDRCRIKPSTLHPVSAETAQLDNAPRGHRVIVEFGRVDTYRTRKAQIEIWLTDARPQVRSFAERFVRRSEQSIAAEQRRAEQNKEMRKRHYDDPEKD